MTDLAGFLLARIAEDESETRWLGPCDCRVEGFPLQHGLRCPERVLAECEAKRRIVTTQLQPYPAGHAPATLVLRLLALPYADHPDYRQEWRP